MGHVFDFKEARAFEQWVKNPQNRFVAKGQNRLMLEMLKPSRGDSVLEIGCGTGMSLRPLVDMGLNTTGLDPSPYMIDIAKKNLGDQIDLHRGFAEDLPFDDNSFNYACFMSTLEFVEDPVRAIEEACRVAKDRLFIGVLNRFAIKSIKRRVKGVFTKTIYNRARFFSVWEVKQILQSILGDVPIHWKTAPQLPATGGRLLDHLEKSWMAQKMPFGTFAGIIVTLVPRFRTKPLNLKYSAKHGIKPVVG